MTNMFPIITKGGDLFLTLGTVAGASVPIAHTDGCKKYELSFWFCRNIIVTVFFFFFLIKITKINHIVKNVNFKSTKTI